jgi:glutamate-1-semialdehyde 2,1-aminomutase
MRLNQLGELARTRLTEAIQIANASACVTGAGSMFRIHMKNKPPANYREVFASAAELAMRRAFIDHMIENGILLIDTCSGMLSTPMTSAEIDRLADVAVDGFRKIK